MTLYINNKTLVVAVVVFVAASFIASVGTYIFTDCLEGCVVHGGLLGKLGMEGMHIR